VKLKFFQQIFRKKISNTKFREIPSSASRDVPSGRTDRHDEANSRISQFCERALKCYFESYKNYMYLLVKILEI